MSDSTNSSLGFLSNWKFSLAVCVPCFAVGLGATYYFYSKSNYKNGRPLEPTAKHQEIDGNNATLNQLKTNGIDSKTVKVNKPVGLFILLHLFTNFKTYSKYCLTNYFGYFHWYKFNFWSIVSVQTLSEQVEEFKKQGNAEFSKQNFEAAIMFYTQALSICPLSEKGLLSTVYQNRAAAYNKLVMKIIYQLTIISNKFLNYSFDLFLERLWELCGWLWQSLILSTVLQKSIIPES